MIGTKVGKWLVIEEVKVEQNRTAVFKHYNCQCECGIIKIVRADGLRNGRSTQCSDCRKKERYIDTSLMVGEKFGKWLVLKELPGDKTQRKVLCKCECGKEIKKSASILKLGKSLQCHLCNVTKHGQEGGLTYNTWRCMMARCTNPRNHNYKNYMERGIKVCQEWHTFGNFFRDMGEKPKGLQLDRIDNNGNYEPNNCRWVTAKENSNNRRR